jgi:two-component system, sensor histidine kinase and response regulator
VNHFRILRIAAFRVRPAVPAKPQAAVPARRRERATGLCVLIAEDNEVNQVVARRLVEQAGHEVTMVANGRMAVDAYSRLSPDLILMDLQMPIMDGLEATQKIRALQAAGANAVPIIALTAYATSGDRERCLAAGMDGYVSKPIRKDDLIREMSRLIRPQGTRTIAVA